jgi:hypothetical protein
MKLAFHSVASADGQYKEGTSRLSWKLGRLGEVETAEQAHDLMLARAETEANLKWLHNGLDWARLGRHGTYLRG